VNKTLRHRWYEVRAQEYDQKWNSWSTNFMGPKGGCLWTKEDMLKTFNWLLTTTPRERIAVTYHEEYDVIV
jgi:hypothetical protein